MKNDKKRQSVWLSLFCHAFGEAIVAVLQMQSEYAENIFIKVSVYKFCEKFEKR